MYLQLVGSCLSLVIFRVLLRQVMGKFYAAFGLLPSSSDIVAACYSQ